MSSEVKTKMIVAKDTLVERVKAGLNYNGIGSKKLDHFLVTNMILSHM